MVLLALMFTSASYKRPVVSFVLYATSPRFVSPAIRSKQQQIEHCSRCTFLPTTQKLSAILERLLLLCAAHHSSHNSSRCTQGEMLSIAPKRLCHDCAAHSTTTAVLGFPNQLSVSCSTYSIHNHRLFNDIYTMLIMTRLCPLHPYLSRLWITTQCLPTCLPNEKT